MNRYQELYEIFVRKPPNSIQEIIAEVKGYIRVEEARLGRNKLRPMEGREVRREDPRPRVLTRVNLRINDIIKPAGTTVLDQDSDPGV